MLFTAGAAAAQPADRPVVAPLFPPAVTGDPDGVLPAAGHRPQSPAAYPCPACPPCLPGVIYPPRMVYPPGTMPSYPAPGTPTTPGTTPPGTMPGTTPPGTTPPTSPDTSAQNPANTPQNPFAQGTEAGGEGARTFNQNFFGDLVGVFAAVRPVIVPPSSVTTIPGQVLGQRVVVVNGQPVTTQVVGPSQTILGPAARLPLTGQYGGITIVENDNPRPMDRVYFGYNYYDRVGQSLNPGGQFVNVNRETIGFEKTFLSGDASVGMRLPFNQTSGQGIDSRQVGDLTLLSKFVLYGDRKTGDLVSTGFILTTPTGGSGFSMPVVLADGSPVPHTWLFQPWAGFVKSFDKVYVQGVTNAVVPATDRTVTFLGNSLGAGYWLYQNPGGRYLTGIIPIAEINVRTPLNHRDPNGLIYMQDMVNVNAGVHFRTSRAVISGAISVPTVGPRPWAVEAIGFLNYLF